MDYNNTAGVSDMMDTVTQQEEGSTFQGESGAGGEARQESWITGRGSDLG